MITVMGATGNTGRAVAHGLLQAGHSVRALGRSELKLASLAAAGAETRVGDVANASFLADAFDGADAAYTLLPTDKRAPDYRAAQDREGEAIAHAVRTSGVRYVVGLSSLGGDIADGTGIITGLHAQEERLKQLDDANILLLRPVSFFENFLDQLEIARQHGIIADSVAPDVIVQYVASRDVADVAIRALAARDWTGVAVRGLLGPRDFTMREMTRILGSRLGNPDLAYVQLSETEMVRTLVDAGLSDSFASQYVEMTRAFNARRIASPAGRTPGNTTPTRFEDFAANLAVLAA